MPMSCDVIHVCLFVNRAYSTYYRWYSAQTSPLLFSCPSVILAPCWIYGNKPPTDFQIQG